MIQQQQVQTPSSANFTTLQVQQQQQSQPASYVTTQQVQQQQAQQIANFKKKQQTAKNFFQQRAAKKIINKAKINQAKFGSPRFGSPKFQGQVMSQMGQNVRQARPQNIRQNIMQPQNFMQNVIQKQPKNFKQNMGIRQMRPTGKTILESSQFQTLYPGVCPRGVQAQRNTLQLAQNKTLVTPKVVSPIQTKISNTTSTGPRIITLNKNKSESKDNQRIMVQTRNIKPVIITTTPDLSKVKREVIDLKQTNKVIINTETAGNKVIVNTDTAANKIVVAPTLTGTNKTEMARAVVHSLMKDSQRSVVTSPAVNSNVSLCLQNIMQNNIESFHKLFLGNIVTIQNLYVCGCV